MVISFNGKRCWTAVLFAALVVALQLGVSARAEEAQEVKDVFMTLTRTPVDQSKLPTNVSVVQKDQLERLGVQNAGDAVEYLSGVNLQKNATVGSARLPKLRGFLNKQVAVFVDDRRVQPDVTGSVDLSQIPAESIERIEVVRGGASVLYGANAEGGVIHIITKRASASAPRAGAALTLKSFNTEIFQAEGSYKEGRLEGYASGSRSRSDGFVRNSDFENKSFNGNTAYDFGRAGKSSVDFSFSRSELGNSGGTPFPVEQFDGDKERTPNSATARQSNRDTFVRAEHKIMVTELGAHGPINLTARATGGETSIKNAGSFGTSTSTLNSQSAFAQLDMPFGFTMGFEYERSFVSSPFSKLPQTNGWGVFFQENFTWKNLTVIPGVRHDNNTEWGNTTNPRLSVVYQALPSLKVSANAGSAFQAPTFADFTDYHPVTGSAVPRTEPGPSPEKSWHYDAGIEWNPTPTTDIQVTLFRADIKDRLAFQSSGFGGTTKNLQDSFNQGVEAEVAHRIGDWCHHSVNYTYTQSRGKGAGVSTEFVDLRFTPKHRVNDILRLTVKPVNADLTSVVQYVSEQYTGNQTLGLKLPEYAVWNLSLAKKIGRVELRAGVDNVLERRYAQNATAGFAGFTPDLYFPQPGRTYWGSVAVKLF